MVDSINLFQNGRGLFGGFSGFLDRSFGNNNDDRPLSGLLNRNSAGLQSNPLLIQSNPLLQQVQQQKENEKADEKKKDEVELSKFVQEAADEAVESARNTPGTTSQVFVSEDGRFEVSVDLQVRSDGSYDLDLAVGFAQSSAAGIQSQTQAIEQQAKTSENTEEVPEDSAVTDPNALPAFDFSSSLSGVAERYTSYEQSLSTRDLEVNIFFEEAKSVEFQARQQVGSEVGDQFNAVAGQVSNEFRLNINISGSDINNFNQAANDLLQFDDTGTLSGFLGAASNILNSDSTNIGSFVEATRALVGATKEHVSSKLNNFFTDLNSRFGGSIEQIGFEPNFIENLGTDVQNDLNSFFSITNNLLSNLTANTQIEDQNTEDSELSILEESLERLRERREEETQSEFSFAPGYNPETDALEKSPRQKLDELLNAINEENSGQDQIAEPKTVDGELGIA